jgi:hypothetical protein
LLISEDESLITSVSSIDFEFSASALLCEQHRIVLRFDGGATQFTKRCRLATTQDRTTFCEIKEGRTWPGDFTKLAWLLEENGFFSLPKNYERNVTDASFVSIRANRDGKPYEVVAYAGAGPIELWVVQRSIEGVASSVEWEKTKRQSECPRWEEPNARTRR